MNSSDRFAQRHTDCESTHDTANVGDVLAAVAVSQNPHDPLEGLELRDVPKPQPRPGWAVVRVAASALNSYETGRFKSTAKPSH